MLWVTRSFADLLDSKATATESGPREILIAVADFHFDGNHAKLARAINRPKSTVSTWTTEAGRMGWQTLCDASYAFHVPLKDILEGNLDAVQTSVVRTLPFVATSRKVRKQAEQPQMERIQGYLETLLEGGAPRMLSMAAVGKSLNVEPREIRRLVPPALYQKASGILKKRMTEYRKWQREFRWSSIKLVLKTMVEQSTTTQYQITRRAMIAELNAAGLWPSFSEIPTLWKLLADARRLVEQEREASTRETNRVRIQP
jgi:DNA-binding phage protein